MKYTVQKANQFFKGDKPIPVGGEIELGDNVLTRKFIERGHVKAPAASGGFVPKSDTFLMGEKGPEPISPASSDGDAD